MDDDREATRGIAVLVLHVIGARRMGDSGGASCSIVLLTSHVEAPSAIVAGAKWLVTVMAVLVDASSVVSFGLSTDFCVFAVLAATARLEVLALDAAVFPDLVLTMVEVVRWKFAFAVLAVIARLELLAFDAALFLDLVSTMVGSCAWKLRGGRLDCERRM